MKTKKKKEEEEKKKRKEKEKMKTKKKMKKKKKRKKRNDADKNNNKNNNNTALYWLLTVPATCLQISRTDLLRPLQVLPHRNTNCRSSLLPHTATVYSQPSVLALSILGRAL